MKILFFNYEYPPLGGGAGNAAKFLLKEYSKMNDLEVDFVTSSVDDQYHLDKVGERIRIHRLPIGKEGESLHYQKQKDLIVYAWKAFWFSLKLMRKQKYDLTHSFFTIPCGALSLYFKLFKKIPYIVSLRGSDVPGYSERFDKLYRLINPLIKAIWNNSAHVIANSEGLRELAMKTKSKKKIGLIPNGIDIQEFDPERFNQRNVGEEKVLICGTRVTPRKGFRFLIDAVEILKKEDQAVRLVIIGEGNEKDELMKRVTEKELDSSVDFLGYVNHDFIPEKLSKADIFLSPALNEGMANFMLEALAMGLPMVVTDTGGTAEILDEGVNGLLIEKESALSIVTQVKKMIENPEMMKKMSEESRRRALNMSWDKVAEQYRQVYQKTL